MSSAVPVDAAAPVTLLALCRATARPLRVGERTVMSGHGKQPVEGPVAVGPMGLDGDEQADPTVHGGRHKALYAYPSEHRRFWQTVRSQAKLQLWEDPVPPGLMGENLHLQGLDEPHAWIGDRLVFPDCVLAISEPRMPCGKFDAAMGFKHATKMMVQSGFCGFYLAVIEGGTLQAGQIAQLQPGPRQVCIADAFRSRAGRHLLR